MSDNVKQSKLNSILLGIVMLLISGIGTFLYAKMQQVDDARQTVAVMSSKLDSLKAEQEQVWSKMMPRAEIETRLAAIEKDMEMVKGDHNDLRFQLIKVQLELSKVSKP